jgi:hypothetical protein
MSQNVRTKAARMTISLSSQDKIRRDKRMLCREKRLIRSHKHVGLRMDDDPVPKAVLDTMDDLDDFQTVVGSTSHAPACLKMWS